MFGIQRNLKELLNCLMRKGLEKKTTTQVICFQGYIAWLFPNWSLLNIHVWTCHSRYSLICLFIMWMVCSKTQWLFGACPMYSLQIKLSVRTEPLIQWVLHIKLLKAGSYTRNKPWYIWFVTPASEWQLHIRNFCVIIIVSLQSDICI